AAHRPLGDAVGRNGGIGEARINGDSGILGGCRVLHHRLEPARLGLVGNWSRHLVILVAAEAEAARPIGRVVQHIQHLKPPGKTAATLGMAAISWPMPSVRLSAKRAKVTTTERLTTSTMRWKPASVPIITPKRVKAAVTAKSVRTVRSFRRTNAAHIKGRYLS